VLDERGLRAASVGLWNHPTPWSKGRPRSVMVRMAPPAGLRSRSPVRSKPSSSPVSGPDAVASWRKVAEALAELYLPDAPELGRVAAGLSSVVT
jgi:hypothetical protein